MVLLYDRTSIQKSVNEARKELFTRKRRAIDTIPLTQAVLMQHIKRAAYQAGHCWSQAMIPNPEILSPSDWGWSKNPEGGWEACWTTLPEASQVYLFQRLPEATCIFGFFTSRACMQWMQERL